MCISKFFVSKVALFFIIITLSSCNDFMGIKSGGGTQETHEETVEVGKANTERGVTGTPSKDSSLTQTLTLESETNKQGTQVQVPPGSLSVDTDVSMQVKDRNYDFQLEEDVERGSEAVMFAFDPIPAQRQGAHESGAIGGPRAR